MPTSKVTLVIFKVKVMNQTEQNLIKSSIIQGHHSGQNKREMKDVFGDYVSKIITTSTWGPFY